MKRLQTKGSTLATICLGLLLSSAAGCKTPDVPGGGYTGVAIDGSSRDDIRVAARAIFQANGYANSQTGFDEMVFEKEEGGMSSLAYGTWMSMTVWTRVKLRIIDMPGDLSYLLQADSYRVTNKGDQFVEEEKKTTRSNRKSLQRMIEDIRYQLDAESRLGTRTTS